MLDVRVRVLRALMSAAFGPSASPDYCLHLPREIARVVSDPLQ